MNYYNVDRRTDLNKTGETGQRGSVTFCFVFQNPPEGGAPPSLLHLRERWTERKVPTPVFPPKPWCLCRSAQNDLDGVRWSVFPGQLQKNNPNKIKGL